MGYNQKDVKLPRRFFETLGLLGVMDGEAASRTTDKHTAKTGALMLEEF